MRVGLISHSGRARDAIGNQLAEKLAFFLERGADVRVYLQTLAGLHPRLTEYAELVNKVAAVGPAWEYLADSDFVLVDYSQFYELLHFLPLLAGKKPRIALDYLGVTPPELWTGPNREALHLGQTQRGLVWCADAAIVHSRRSRAELQRATGFPLERIFQIGLVAELECIVDTPSVPGSHPIIPNLGDGRLLLFVGRLAGNKRVPILIEALSRLRGHQPPFHAAIVGDHGDVYAEEHLGCRELAIQLGVEDRVHFLGQISAEELSALYRSAAALVLPSVHEGFCLPVIEAMAHGLPVIAARSSALPETVGDAGLTFTPDDADDLARQIRRVLGRAGSVSDRSRPAADPTPLASASCSKGRIAIACFRFADDIVGGAERSLRTIALTLRRAGYDVEIFTTCNRHESDWVNELPAGSVVEHGLSVHRFAMDAHDRERHLEAVRQIIEADGRVDTALEAAYLRHSIHSSALIEALGRRADEFGAIITGPYLFGLTWDIARAFPEKTLLLPCFHDEPIARLAQWPKVFGQVGGILYHSPEEQDLAQADLGVNHPRAFEIGTWMEQSLPVRQIDRNKEHAYLVYCGRFSAQKDVPRLLEYAANYEALHPGRFRWLFLGQGETPIPEKPWLVNLGRLSEERKREVLRDAAALVQLSRHESLSLVALEAWAEGTPVIVDRACAVLRGQVERALGGRAIDGLDDFVAALDDLWDHPQIWRDKGLCGQAYVRRRYGSEDEFAARLQEALDALTTPLRDHMRRRGCKRAEAFTRTAWRQAFGQFVEKLLDAAPRTYREEIELQPCQSRLRASLGARHLLASVRVHNRGSHAAVAEGPGRTCLFCEVIDEISGKQAAPLESACLPALVPPGQMQIAALPVRIPQQPGQYLLRAWAGRSGSDPGTTATIIELEVTPDASAEISGLVGPLLEHAREALAEADRLKRLPEDYVDVTLGRFARLKRWLKGKLLGNFKRAYVDVLSRQQSQVNQKLMTAVQQLADCCAALEHALRECRRTDLQSVQKEGAAADGLQIRPTTQNITHSSSAAIDAS
ncbi:MAG: glycosyltransferase [Planctomycetes bacterium]|nr:glycosyltransferase [Planctomycetota bacterium]